LKDSQHDIDGLTAAREEAVNAAKEADRKNKMTEADLRQLQDDLASSERARKAAQSERDDLLEELNSGSSARLMLFLDYLFPINFIFKIQCRPTRISPLLKSCLSSCYLQFKS